MPRCVQGWPICGHVWRKEPAQPQGLLSRTGPLVHLGGPRAAAALSPARPENLVGPCSAHPVAMLPWAPDFPRGLLLGSAHTTLRTETLSPKLETLGIGCHVLSIRMSPSASWECLLLPPCHHCARGQSQCQKARRNEKPSRPEGKKWNHLLLQMTWLHRKS